MATIRQTLIIDNENNNCQINNHCYYDRYNSPSKQVGLARGNINPLTLETMDTFSPAKVFH